MSKLYFKYGAMSCGKSTAALQVAHNYESLGMTIMLMKPAIDTKGNRKIVSRIGAEREATHIIQSNDSIGRIVADYMNEKQVGNIDCIIIDEAQFLEPKQVEELYRISKLSEIPIICYGLRCDFRMQPFPGSARLLEIADDLEEMKTICRCGEKATNNIRYINDAPTFEGDQVLIDNSAEIKYESACGKCYLLKKDPHLIKNKD